jgi:ABC-type polysaccharide/polyol phosphate export permease
MKPQNNFFVLCLSVVLMTVIWLLGTYAVLKYTPSWGWHWLDQLTLCFLLVLNCSIAKFGFLLINASFEDPS